MCGIAGVQVRAGEQVSQQTLNAFAKCLHHRGPDTWGSLLVANLGLVSTRLAIMDVEHGQQPLRADSGAALVANGEIYNSPALRAEFPEYAFKTHSDCEVILPLYERHGVKFADYLRGMYAIALYDPYNDRLILSRDPFGIKPLYLAQSDGCIAFASEIGPLLDLNFATRDTCKDAEREWLQLKYVSGSKSIVPGITRLEPGLTLVIENGVVVEEHCVPTWPRHAPPTARSNTHKSSRQSLLSGFSKVIEDSVSVHLHSDVPWCLFYSGGIDSTILMRVAQRVSAVPFQALTIGYDGEHAEDESLGALELAKRAGVPCERIEMTAEDFWAYAPRIVAALDDPMADPAVLPLYMLAAAARNGGYKIALSGEGADEVFGGYSRYRRANLPAFMRGRRSRRGVYTTSSISTERFAGWDKEMDALEAVQNKLWSGRMQMLQAVDMLERLPNCLLIKLDRALMANSIEGRTPFLDKEVAQFALDVPDKLKANLILGKLLLRDWLGRDFPAINSSARKKGFDLPLGPWIATRREELAPLLSVQPAVARIFEPSEVRAILDGCTRNEQAAWSLIQFALWHAHHIQNVACDGDILAVLSQSARH